MCACVFSFIVYVRALWYAVHIRPAQEPPRQINRLLERDVVVGGRRERERKDLACVVYMSVLCSDDQCLAIIWIRALLYTLLLFDSPLPFYPFLYNIGESTFSHSTATKNREKLN